MSSISTDPAANSAGPDGAGAAAAAAASLPKTVNADDHWPICRCGHPMHPNKIELRRGVQLERFECPRQRWWNMLLHPYAWLPPRTT